ncbi:hypothetical protein LPTSP2_06370 [Leptospira ellinghausenii]|uniref:Uncharacterized protein n=1 Tax=Leptospira ellinghausenii TaxID=1917822 RepID=A0A2P2D9W2_9LEPT|nr:hypothetical protein LPTSP2_06370 [Leptospira ellinghausenii]
MGIAKQIMVTGNMYDTDSDAGNRKSFLKLKVAIKNEMILADNDVIKLGSFAFQN